jgi:hypothetical protein
MGVITTPVNTLSAIEMYYQNLCFQATTVGDSVQRLIFPWLRILQAASFGAVAIIVSTMKG